MQQVNELLDSRLVSFEMPLHASVGRVAYPALHAKMISLLLRPRAEEHALDHSRDTNVDGDLRP